MQSELKFWLIMSLVCVLLINQVTAYKKKPKDHDDDDDNDDDHRDRKHKKDHDDDDDDEDDDRSYLALSPPIIPARLSSSQQHQARRPRPSRGPAWATCGRADLNKLTARGSPIIDTATSNGFDQKYGEWPSFVRLSLNGVGWCGGVIVDDRHVLTAAHCIYKNARELERPGDFKVTVAEHNTTNPNDLRQRDYFVESYCGHTKYRHKNYKSYFDYALLTLTERVQFNEHVQPACWPQPGAPIPNAHCHLVGLGLTNKPHQDSTPTIVQKLPVVEKPCDSNEFNSATDASRICYTKKGGPGDACKGDSGGPVLCLSQDNKWTVTGLVSYGETPCSGSSTLTNIGVYADVQKAQQHLRSACAF